jgi:hypothetical protein
MENMDEKFRKRLEEEAAQWVEKELFTRMIHAKEAIQEQADISQPEIGPKRAGDHVKKALSFAQEHLRMDLEVEAQAWIEEEIRKRNASLKGDL